MPLSKLKHKVKRGSAKILRKMTSHISSLPSDRLVSLTEREWQALFRRNRLSDYLPYWLYDEASGIYEMNDNTYSMVFECNPRIYLDGKAATSFVEILDKLPEEVIFQIVLMGGRNNYDRLNKWEAEHLSRVREDANSILVGKTVSNMRLFFEAKHSESINDVMRTRIKSFRFFVSLKHKDKSVVAALGNQMKGILAANFFAPNVAHPSILKPLLYELLNGDVPVGEIPEYTPMKELNKQLIGGETEIAFYGDHNGERNTAHVRISSQYTGKKANAKGKYWVAFAPQSLPEQAHIFDFGNRIGDKDGNSLDSNQIMDNFIVSTTIVRKPKKAASKISRNHATNLRLKFPDHLFRRLANVRKESVEILDKIDEKHEPIFSYDLDVLISGATYEEMEQNAAIVKSFWNKGGKESSIKLEKVPDVNHLAFLSSMPMGATTEYIDTCGKSFSLFGNQLAQFIPAEADYCGNGHNIPFITRRGALCWIDMFISDTNFNGFVIATSGAGKSVFLQMLAFNSYARGDRVFVMDIGYSQKKLCEVLGGQFLEPDPKNPISFNPFSAISSEEELQEELAYLTDFCYMLGSSKNKVRAEEDERFIKAFLGDIIKRRFESRGNRTEVTDIQIEIGKEEDQRCKDFARQMSLYCRGGLYEKFFAGKSEINFKGEFIVAELTQIENDSDIRDPIIMMLIYHLNKSIFQNKSAERKKLVCIIDEAHKFLGKNARMDDFVEQAYRRFRKEGGSIIIATQGFDDIYVDGKLSRAGAAIVNSSAWKFFLMQTETSVNMLLQSGVFSLTEYEKELIRGITTKKGKYSEVFLMTPSNMKLPVRVVMDRFFYYITTTDPNDKKKIQAIIDREGVDMSSAIEILIGEEAKR